MSARPEPAQSAQSAQSASGPAIPRVSMPERAAGLAYAAAWRTVRLLPERLVGVGAERMADRTARRAGRGVRTLRANLAVVRPDATEAELDELVRRDLRSYARYWTEVFRLPDLSRGEVLARITVRDEHRLRDAFDAGGGVVGALPHMANYDHAGAWATTTGMPITTIAERLRPESLYERFLAYRARLGMEILPLTGHDEPVLDVLTRRLSDQGRFVPLIADRDLSDTGVPVTMFGHPTKLPAGPAVLALRTGAPLLPITGHYDEHVDRMVRFRIHEAITPGPVPEMIQGVADAFAEAIDDHPHDWHMLQRYFLDLPPAAPRRD